MFGIVFLMWGAIFATFALLTYGILTYCSNRRIVKERIKGPATGVALPLLQLERRENSFKKRVLEWVSSFGKWGVKDREEASRIRTTLIQAGFRHPKGAAIYFGSRLLGAFFLPLAFLLVSVTQGKVNPRNMMVAFLLSGAGFYLPVYVLQLITRRRQDRIDKALPDILDLLIVCLESGLSLTATLNRVGDEARALSKELYRELQIVNAELRAGIPREVALKNLGERTGVQSVKSLVALMIQSEKLGASIAKSLRTHASFLRVQRGLKAEEMAAKLPVKILFPMIFFIFPAIFVVVLGPAAIQMSKSVFFSS
jgi:tight adherence protein C